MKHGAQQQGLTPLPGPCPPALTAHIPQVPVGANPVQVEVGEFEDGADETPEELVMDSRCWEPWGRVRSRGTWWGGCPHAGLTTAQDSPSHP